VPADAVFFTPLGARTFKWYTGRGDVANFKDVPLDGASIVAWWERLAAIHGSRLEGDEAEDQSATEAAHLLSLRQLRELGTQYGAEYVIAPRSRRLPPLTPLYRNRDYAIYRLTEESP
jgi:hypothetical protein